MRGEEKKLAENRERVEVIRERNIIFKWNSDRVVRLMTFCVCVCVEKL